MAYHNGILVYRIRGRRVALVVISFVVAYALYPFLKKLQEKGVRKSLAVALILVCVLGFLIVLISLLIPIIAKQIAALSTMILSLLYDLVVDFLPTNLEQVFIPTIPSTYKLLFI